MSEGTEMIRMFCVAHGHATCQPCHFAQFDTLKALESKLAAARAESARLREVVKEAKEALDGDLGNIVSLFILRTLPGSPDNEAAKEALNRIHRALNTARLALADGDKETK